MYKKSKFIAYALCIALVLCIGYVVVDKRFLSKKKQPSTPVESQTSDMSSGVDDEDEIPEQEFYTVCSHDLGYFNYSTASHYEGADVTEQFENWKNTIAELKADFYFCQEYQPYFDTAYTMPSIELYNDSYRYNHIYSSAYGSVGIMSDFRLVDADFYRLISDQPGYEQTNRPGVIASTKAGDKLRVWLSTFTLFPSSSPMTADAAREEQLTQLMDNRWLRKSRYAIIGGNFNSEDANLRQILEENGFTLCLGSDVDTGAHEGTQAIDNIAVKGFEVVEANVLPEKSCTSNHYPIMVKLKKAE